MRATFQTKLISAPVTYAKSFHGSRKFRSTDVTPQINTMESAEGKTIVGWARACSGKNLQDYTKNTRFRAFWKQVLV